MTQAYIEHSIPAITFHFISLHTKIFSAVAFTKSTKLCSFNSLSRIAVRFADQASLGQKGKDLGNPCIRPAYKSLRIRSACKSLCDLSRTIMSSAITSISTEMKFYSKSSE